MSGNQYGGRPRRSAAPVVALVLGVIALLIGAAALGFAAQYKPTLENAIANGGEVLSSDSYNVIRGIGFVALVVGGVAVLGGIVGLASRPSVVVQPPQQPVYYGQQPQWQNPAPQQWVAPAAPPAPAAVAAPPVAAPPPDAAQRVG